MSLQQNRPLFVFAISILLACNATMFARSINEAQPAGAGVLLGPCGSAAAQGPNGIDDDYSNESIDARISLTGDGLTSSPATVVFKNTVENAGRGDDAFMITPSSWPPGFTIEMSDDFGAHYTMLDRWTSSVTLP